ncbi:MAG: homoserine dehydrogenase [Synechococcales cyanobacterium]
MTYKLGLLGLGTVGTGVVQLCRDPYQRHSLTQEIEIYRVGVRSLRKPRGVELHADALTTDLESIVRDPQVDIVVEVLGGLEPARTLILTAIAHGKHVVTANKAVIARFGEEIFAAAHAQGVYVLLEAAVGGGIPIIQPLRQCLVANRIQGILGIVNGTTNFILTRMSQEQASFAATLALAQQQGYAEADPSADIDGHDAADKITILANLAFGCRVERPQVTCEGIRTVTATDIRYAQEWGLVIKLLAIAQRQGEYLDIRVHPTLIPHQHPLAAVHDVNNAVLILGDPVGEVMLSGPGAGRGPTASAVMGDVLTIAAHLKSEKTSLNPLLDSPLMESQPLLPIEQVRCRYYVRVLTADRPGVIGIIGTCFGEHHVSLECIVQKTFHTDPHGGDDQAEIVILTHNVWEKDLQSALSTLRQDPVILGIPSLFRVLPEV